MMKRAGKLCIITVSLFAVIFTVSNLIFSYAVKQREDNIYVLMNRVYAEITGRMAALGEEMTPDAPDALISDVFDSHRSEFISEYGAGNVPDRVFFLSAGSGESDVNLLNRGRAEAKIWVLYSEDGPAGFLVFEFGTSRYGDLRILMNLCLAAAFIITMAICIYINIGVLKPFDRFASYPERLSRNQITEKLPETGNRLFGRFAWGLNMLGDRLAGDREKINELSREHLTMLTNIAHGIKTPVANIKLYSDAIETGLDQPDGTPNESDADVASRISRNADDITKLVEELIEKASGGVVGFDPKPENFYLSELVDFLNEEYKKRLELLRIPYEFNLSSNAIIKSDKEGICRILSQFMENAVKYGNGEGIFVRIEKEDDGYHLSVRNKGQVLDKRELPFVFGGFWRGSNSAGIEGSGIGLFESYEITRRLEGEIYARSHEDAGEMEFEVILPL